VEVSFIRAKFSVRLIAFAVDFLIMFVFGLIFVIAAQQILLNVPYYQKASNTLNKVELLSHLYSQSDTTEDVISLADYYDPETDEEYGTAQSSLDEALTYFFSSPDFFTSSTEGQQIYTDIKLDSDYFIYADESHTSIEVVDGTTNQDLFEFYQQVIKEDALTYMMQYPQYVEAAKVLNLSFIFIILLIPIVLSVTIFELLVPCIFHRGYKTFGKLLFKLAVVDNRGLSPKFWVYFLRFIILLLVELILSLVTFIIPLVVSFSMFVFSKKQQSFHDYMMGTYVVDASQTRVFINEKEYRKAMAEAAALDLKEDNIKY
jgi:uncharacterized RDD family membrane protein YckC